MSSAWLVGALHLLRRLFHALTPHRFRWLMVAATLAHVIFIFTYESHFGVDGEIYRRVAGNILQATDLLACGALEDAYWPPLFCYYLAGWLRLFGDVHWLFFLINVSMALGIGLLSKSFLQTSFGAVTARWAVLGYYCSLIVFYFTMYYKYELLASFLFFGALHILTSDRRLTNWRYPAAGMLMGLSILASAKMAVLVPALVYLILKRLRMDGFGIGWFRPVIFVGLAFLTILPWTTRNYICFDRLIPITTNGGINFYIGFNARADGRFVYKADFPAPYDELPRTDDAAYYAGGMEFIRNQPGTAVWLMLKKVYYLWRIHYADTALFFPFFYVGVFLVGRFAKRERRPYVLTILYLLLLYTIFHCFFFSRHYYVLPVLPLVHSVAIATQRAFGGRLLMRLQPVTFEDRDNESSQ